MRRATRAWRIAIVARPMMIETRAPRTIGTKVQKKAPMPPVMVMPRAVRTPVPVKALMRSVQVIWAGGVAPFVIAVSWMEVKTPRRLEPMMLLMSTAT